MTTQPTYNFNNKTAIVTGAGGGMGKEITLALSKFGANIYGIDLKEKPEEYTNLNIKYFQEDITKFEKIDLIFNQAFKETKRLDFLANVAGVLLFGKDKSLVDIDLDVYEWELYQNLNISKSHFIIFGYDRNIFEDLYGKQGNHIVTINTNNLYINNTNQGDYRIEYYFQDEDTIRININKSDLTIRRRKEGLKISTPYSNFFILNQNFFEYRRKLDSDGA